MRRSSFTSRALGGRWPMPRSNRRCAIWALWSSMLTSSVLPRIPTALLFSESGQFVSVVSAWTCQLDRITYEVVSSSRDTSAPTVWISTRSGVRESSEEFAGFRSFGRSVAGGGYLSPRSLRSTWNRRPSASNIEFITLRGATAPADHDPGACARGRRHEGEAGDPRPPWRGAAMSAEAAGSEGEGRGRAGERGRRRGRGHGERGSGRGGGRGRRGRGRRPGPGGARRRRPAGRGGRRRPPPHLGRVGGHRQARRVNGFEVAGRYGLQLVEHPGVSTVVGRAGEVPVAAVVGHDQPMGLEGS